MKINDKNKIYFTSDTHFYHGNILKFCPERAEFLNDEERKIMESGDKWAIRNLKISEESIQVMNEAMIERWNSVVPKDGIVFFLGDFALKCNSREANNIRYALNGKIYFIEGNHDGVAEQIKSSFDWLGSYQEIKVADKDAERGEQDITLLHYSMRVWNKSHHGSWMLYGHSHNSLPDDPNARSFDVGVDCHNFYPLSYDQVKEIMSKKTFVPIDHHGG